MLSIAQLRDYDIFVIPVGDFFDKPKQSLRILYAPFAKAMVMVDEDGWQNLTVGDIEPLRIDGDKNRFFSKVDSLDTIQKMAVLPNHTCNFGCSYCYSAKGRSNTTLSPELLSNGIDYFIDPQRTNRRNLSLSFIGGGEPLLSWDLVKMGIERATSRAQQFGFDLTITLITNGSIMNDDIIHTLQLFHVLPDVSFDILEDVQNKNRKHFDTVCKTIDSLCANGLVPSINATITPDSVLRMEEMVQFMNHRFPLITNMVFEPVVSDALFPTADDLGLFYAHYIEGFFAAKSLAASFGKNVTCRIYKNIDSILDRGCPSKFTLTPQGDVSICYCKSSPKEDKYNERIYGKVSADGVELDAQKFSSIHSENVYSQPKCEACFAKWHCGGGCMCPNDLYDEAHLEQVCQFTRQMVRHTLIERMEENCFNRHNCSLSDYYNF